ncbi:MAG: hypothetical protein FJX74_13150 [Armatimonadetes bacterium]|nr:hypothetical protein [Armatimonadota bacterium]
MGQGIYSPTGVGQELRESALRGATTTYLVAVGNDGPVAETFSVHGTAGDEIWEVSYYRGIHGSERDEITWGVTSAEGEPMLVQPGGAKVVRVEVRARPSEVRQLPAVKSVRVWADSPTSMARDLVWAVTTLEDGAHADLMIRVKEFGGVGEGIQNSTGEGQRVDRKARRGVTTKYQTALANDGTLAGSFIFRGTAGNPNWQVRYARGSGNTYEDVTEQMTSPSGWRFDNLEADSLTGVRVEVTPAAAVRGGDQQSVKVWVRYAWEPNSAIQDLVRMVTTAEVDGTPDLLIRDQANGWIGDDLYEFGAALFRQIVYRTDAPGTTRVYRLQVENDGTEADDFMVSGSRGDANWDVRYYTGLSGGTDITAAMSSRRGWGPIRLHRGESQRFRAEVTVPAGAKAGERRRVWVTAERYQRENEAPPTVRRDQAELITTAAGVPPTSAVAGLAAVPTAMGAEVVFTLAGDAGVSARVLNLAGRPVRTLCADRLCTAGTQRLVWNALADTGLPVPNGQYLIEVTARTATGQQSRSLATVRLDR